MELFSIVFVLVGSVSGLTLRIFFEQNLTIKTGFYVNNISLINFLASFLLGIFIALDLTNNNLLLLFYVGFLGCFSTFSSFIYQLFILLKNGQIVRFFLHYLEVIIISFVFFYLGYYLIKFIEK